MNDLVIKKKERTYLKSVFEITWENLSPIFDELAKRSIGSATELEQWLRDRSELDALLEEDFAWRYIRMTCNTADEALLNSFQYFATEIEPKVAPLNDQLNRKFIESPFLTELDQSKYAILIRGTKQALALFREENIPLQTTIQVEQQKYQGITGAMSVTLNGQEYTLEQAATFLKDTNRETRKNAWQSISNRRLVEKDTLNDLFNTLRALRHQVAQNANFDNFRDYMFAALGRFDYTAEDCFQFHEAIEKTVVPVLAKHADARKKALALPSLQPWDMEVDTSGKPALKPFKDGAELIEKSITCFGKLDPFLGDRLQAMKANGLFDVESRKGKAPGGYNYPMMESGAPFVFMNATGSMEDLETMMHEGGHAVHSFLVHPLRLNVYRQTPSETAELASMSMELLSMAAYPHFFGNDEDKHGACHEQIQRALGVLPWIACIDAFQHWMYTHPGHSRNERSKAWQNLLSQYTSPVVDWRGLEEWLDYQWQGQLHLFEMPFYYIEYGFAQIGALGVWRNSTTDPAKGLTAYREALALGNTVSINEVYRQAGVPFDADHAYLEELANWTLNKMQHHENHLHRT